MFRMADQMRDYGTQTVAVIPEREGIYQQYEQADVETHVMWSEPVRRRRSLLGHIVFFALALVTTLRLAWLIRRENVDTLHVNEIRYPYALLSGFLAGVPTVCHIRANYESKTLRKLFATWTVLFSDQVLCVSDRTKELMFEDVDRDADHVNTIYDGLPSPERLENAPNDGRFRAECGVSSDTRLVLSLSKFVHTKGQDRVIDAAERLTDTKDETNIHFAFVGGSVDGHEEYHLEMQSRIRECENASFVGFYEDAIEAMIESNLLVHVPRDEDPFPGVVLEAMMAGTPVIGSQTGGIPEQITEGETGILVPNTDTTEQLTTTIADLVTDPNRCQKIGTAAQDYVAENFSQGMYFTNLRQLYTNLE